MRKTRKFIDDLVKIVDVSEDEVCSNLCYLDVLLMYFGVCRCLVPRGKGIRRVTLTLTLTLMMYPK